ncbi:hypothetical protein LJC11_02970, partial [Bacteroidales bacterium OttesenSCG-928-I21]|nr:hypothetical protein [Bacteroidales bacterium OttesenSCG-928-I21]
IENTGCKDFSNNLSAKSLTSVSNDVSRVDYSYDAAKNQLTLKHINTAFNCCSENLYCNISVTNDSILIKEYESTSVYEMCDCNCLYDLDIPAINVETKKYTVKFTEQYYSGKNKIVFDIDLAEKTEGSFSVARREYPWEASFNGTIIDESDCDQDVIISQTEFQNAPNDPVSIISAEIIENCLKIKFAASGCDGNSWIVKLIDAEVVAESYPCQRGLRLSLDNKEMCDAVITKEISFNIEDLQIGKNDKVLLHIGGKEILYEY